MSGSESARYSVSDLLELMARLRDPATGCSWDQQQNYRSIAPSTIEEAYEVVDAIERDDYEHLREELGDLLFQVVFYSQLAAEEERFNFEDVVADLTAKLVRRHPHVFPDGTLSSRRRPGELDELAINKAWEAIKEEERQAKGARGVLDDVPATLPATSRAAKLQKRASRCGFDWTQLDSVLDQLDEEAAELREAVTGGNAHAIAEEVGDLLFAAVNVTRHLRLDPETVLRAGNRKFERRFRFIEDRLRERGSSPEEAKVAEMETLWQEAKREGL